MNTQRGFFRNPTAVVLALVTVVALVLAGLIGAELYTRHTADSKVTNAVQCEVQDSASVSFAVTPPVLWQYITGHYTNISVQTAGNQVRSAKGMKISLDIHDVRLANSGNSKGTIGALNGTIAWSSEGIKESIQDAIPVLGSLVTSKVTTSPSDGTVQLKGLLDSATVKPQIANNGLSLQLVELRALGSKLSTNTVQKTSTTSLPRRPKTIHWASMPTASRSPTPVWRPHFRAKTPPSRRRRRSRRPVRTASETSEVSPVRRAPRG